MTTINLKLFVLTILLLFKINAIVEAYNCSSTGKYPDDEDISCKYYILCQKSLNDQFTGSQYKCPGATMFDQNLRRCALNTSFECLKALQSTIEPIVTETTQFFDQESYEKFDSIEKVVSAVFFDNYESIQMETSTSQMEPEATLECKQSGRFLDNTSSNCTRYILCTNNQDGAFVGFQFICPNKTIFSNKLRKCVTDYNCSTAYTEVSLDNTISRTTEILNKESSTVPTFIETPDTTDFIIIKTLPACSSSSNEHVCKTTGKFLDQLDMNCEYYYLCLRTQTGELVYARLRCPKNTIFSTYDRNCMPVSQHYCVNRLKVIPLNN